MMQTSVKILVTLEVTTASYDSTVQFISDLYHQAREEVTLQLAELPDNMRVIGETKIIAVMAESS